MHTQAVMETSEAVEHWLTPALQVLVVFAIATVVLVIGRWLITRTLRSVEKSRDRLRRGAAAVAQRAGLPSPPEDAVARARQAQRARTLASVARSVLGVVIALGVITALATILSWDLGPLLASAGILGVALGFGAQSLVKDVLSGMFMLIEDQYGVGDIIDVGEAAGTVEEIGLRVTRIRDVSGTLWFVRNGEILRVGNMTQGWSRAIVDVAVAPGEDAARGVVTLEAVAAAASEDPAIAPHLLAEPEVWAYNEMTAEAVTLRLLARVVPAQQWGVQRVLRARIIAAFGDEGLVFALPRREVVVEREKQQEK